MGEIVFVRHGQASFGTDDYDRLSPLGWQQARWLGAHFSDVGRRFDMAVSGALRRHRETAEAIAEEMHLPETRVLPGLDEMDFETLHDDAIAAGVVERHDDHDPIRFGREFPLIMHGWERDAFATTHESYADFSDRVTSAVETLKEEGRDVLIVSSGGPKAVMMRHVLGLGTDKMAEVLLGIMNASFTRFLVRQGALKLAEFNATPHLASPDREHARTYI